MNKLRRQFQVVDTDELVVLAQSLARFPSPQTDLFERDHQVQAFLSECVAHHLQVRDLSWRRDAMGGLIVEAGPLDSPIALLFVAYGMTHPVNRMLNPFDAEILDKPTPRIRGRGLAEQKGALAAAVAGFDMARRGSTLSRRIVLAITPAGETGRHDAARAVIDSLGELPAATVIAVGTGGRVALGNKGRIDVEVTVKGRSTHSSTPWSGIDAIDGARRVLDNVVALDIGARTHPSLGASTLTATSIRSWPEATHTLQDEVRIVFDRRLLPGDEPSVAFKSISQAAEIGPPWMVEMRLGPVMLPAEVAADGALVCAIQRAHTLRAMSAPPTFFANASLDAGLFCSLGKEAVMWGPGASEDWHSPDEGVDIVQMVAAANGYAALIDVLAGTGLEG